MGSSVIRLAPIAIALALLCASERAEAAKIPIIYQTGQTSFESGPLPSPFDKEPGLGGFSAGYVCDVTGVFYSYFSIENCRPAAVNGDVFADDAALAAAIAKEYPEPEFPFWSEHGWKVVAGSLGLLILFKIVRRKKRTTASTEERRTQFGLSAVDPTVAEQHRTAWERPSTPQIPADLVAQAPAAEQQPAVSPSYYPDQQQQQQQQYAEQWAQYYAQQQHYAQQQQYYTEQQAYYATQAPVVEPAPAPTPAPEPEVAAPQQSGPPMMPQTWFDPAYSVPTAAPTQMTTQQPSAAPVGVAPDMPPSGTYPVRPSPLQPTAIGYAPLPVELPVDPSVDVIDETPLFERPPAFAIDNTDGDGPTTFQPNYRAYVEAAHQQQQRMARGSTPPQHATVGDESVQAALRAAQLPPQQAGSTTRMRPSKR